MRALWVGRNRMLPSGKYCQGYRLGKLGKVGWWLRTTKPSLAALRRNARELSKRRREEYLMRCRPGAFWAV